MTNYTAQWIGTATVLIRYGDITIITDPAFDLQGGHYDMGFATLEKTANPALRLDELPDIDLVLLSHDQHADNLDDTGRELVKKSPRVLTTKEGAQRLGGNVTGMNFWETYTLGDITITAMPAQHGPEEAIPVIGTVIGFLITSPHGPSIYINGDTVPFEGTQNIIDRYKGKIDYALLHTGSVAEGDSDDTLTYFTMTASEAVEFVKQADVKKFSIIHADSWAHFREKMPAALDIARASSVADRLIDLTHHKEGTIR